MRITRIGIAAVLSLTLFAATGFAATAAPKVHHANGKVSAVDAGAMNLTLSAKNNHEKISWNASTAIVENGKSVPASAISTGEEVRIAFTPESGKNLASRIEIVRNGATAASAKKPAH